MLPDAFEHQLEGAKAQRIVLVAGREALCAERAREAFSEEPVDESRVAAGPGQLREAVELWQTPSWFDAPRLVVAWGVEALAPSARATKEREAELAALERLIQGPTGQDRLLLWAPEADRRLRPVRLLQERGALLDASPPTEREYGAWVRHLAAAEELSLTPQAARAYEESALDLLALRAALRVGALYADDAPLHEDVARWAAPPGGELKVFALTDALLGRDAGGLSTAVPRLLAQGESPIGLVALAARQLRLIARALALRAQGVPQQEWPSRLGVHPYVASKIADASRRWAERDLRRAFRALLNCDLSLKSGGAAETSLLLGLMSAVRSR
ncbi:MAG: DNA polymerase III subunit delta [Thermaerobacter sp.]|nr:DNA polymerase III subunit delta [Thermaerobacter sp.]